MKFEIQQRYDVAPDDLMRTFTDPALYATYHSFTRIAAPEVLDRAESGGIVTLRLRMRFIAPLSAAAKAVVDPAKLTWVQEEIYDFGARRATVVFRPDNYADRFSCSGEYVFAADAGGSFRRQEGNLRIRVLLVSGEVERGVIRGLQDHADEEQPVVAQWLADRREC